VVMVAVTVIVIVVVVVVVVVVMTIPAVQSMSLCMPQVNYTSSMYLC
jgi:hypothetical protein